MEVIRQWARRAWHWEHFIFCVMLVLSLAAHFAVINNPQDFVLDEKHYINDARSIISDNGTLRPEHPPLGKAIIVGSIEVFGDHPWAWRLPSIIFGTAGIVCFYFLCRRLGMSRSATNIATFLITFDNMMFCLSSVAMLDVFFVTLMIAAFLLYAYRRFAFSGIAIGLSALAKLYGALAAPVIFVHWLFTRTGRSKWFLLAAFFAILVFVELMIPLDLAIARDADKLADPIARIKTMLSMSGTLQFGNVEHPALSRPWEWIYLYEPMAFHVDPHYNAAISFSLWPFIVPSFAYMVYLAWRKRSEAGLFGAAWFFGTFLVWIPVSIITDRVSYVYYFYPAVGAVCLGVALGLDRLLDIFRNRERGKLKWTMFGIVVFVLVVHVVAFVFLTPVFNTDYSWFLNVII